MKRILVLGAGKRISQNIVSNKNNQYVFVDICYNDSELIRQKKNISLIADDVFSFLERNITYFDEVHADRLFEHIPYESISYLLYLLYNNLKPKGELEFIVPNYEDIAIEMFNLQNIKTPTKFNAAMIAVHTEMFNTGSDTHKSIWTPFLAKYYLGLENLYKSIKVKRNIKIDNRNWYMSVSAKTK